MRQRARADAGPAEARRTATTCSRPPPRTSRSSARSSRASRRWSAATASSASPPRASRGRRSPPRRSTPSAASSTTRSSRPGARCPIEVVLSGDAALGARMLDDAASSSARCPSSPPTSSASPPTTSSATTSARRRASSPRGIATPAQVDDIVNDAVGGGGPFNVMDLTARQPAHRALPGADARRADRHAWFAPPAILRSRATRPGTTRESRPASLRARGGREQIVDRILAVLLGAHVPSWSTTTSASPPTSTGSPATRSASRAGSLELAESARRRRGRTSSAPRYAAAHPGLPGPASVAESEGRPLRSATCGSSATATSRWSPCAAPR